MKKTVGGYGKAGLILYLLIDGIASSHRAYGLLVRGAHGAAFVSSLSVGVVIGIYYLFVRIENPSGESAKIFTSVTLAIAWLPAAVVTTIVLSIGLNAYYQPHNRIERALKLGDERLIERIVARYSDDADFLQSGLNRAIHHDRADSVPIFINAGADVNGVDQRMRNTPLQEAVDHGRSDIARKLLESGSNPYMTDSEGRNALHMAVRTGHYPLVRTLVHSGVDVTITNDRNKWTALHYAMASYRPDDSFQLRDVPGKDIYYNITELLLTAGADVNARTTYGWTPIMLYRSNHIGRNTGIVFLLLNRGAWDITPSRTMETCLHEAAGKSQISRIRDILDEGYIHIDTRTVRGTTPLHQAIISGNDPTVELLVRRGSQLDLNHTLRTFEKGDIQLSVLGLAVRHQRNRWILDLMIQHGAPVDSDDPDVYSALEVALDIDDHETAEYLMTILSGSETTP